MGSNSISLLEKVDQRKKDNAFRELKDNKHLIDFCSNDYLGFASKKEIHLVNEDLTHYGSTGSRLLSGNSNLIEKVEQEIAKYHGSSSALIFNSGYTANLGFFSCVPQRGDTIIYDEIIHASIRDGIRLSHANSFSFKHNNCVSLEEKIKKSEGKLWVVVESVYSMDGDVSPLEEILTICKKYHAALIVDEAHAVGIYGDKGGGLVAHLNLEDEVFARVITFGKALGCHGAAILGEETLRDYLINFSRPFIYTTTLSLPSVLTIRNAYSFLEKNIQRKGILLELIHHFKSKMMNQSIINSDSAIQCLVVPGNDKVKELADKIQKQGFDVRPILSPTVPKGKERLRICLHAFNKKEQIDKLTDVINSSLKEDVKQEIK